MRWGHEAVIDCPRRGRFIERIVQGAFTEAIAVGTVELWIDHDHKRGCAAHQADGSLVLVEDGVGLWFEASIPSTPDGDDALRLARGAGYRGCSVGMRDVKANWVDGVRTIISAGLREISICRRGAYPTSVVAAGALRIAELQKQRRLERLAAAGAGRGTCDR